MSEQEIASDLAAKIAIDEPPATVEVKPEEPKDPAPPGMTPEASLERMKLFDYFEIKTADRYSAEAETYLNKIIEWARDESGSSDYTDILRAISDQERILGIKLKPERLSRLYRFAVIRAQRNRLVEAERALYD